MRLGKILLSSVGAAALIGFQLLVPASAAAQTVSPCCAKICAPGGTSAACQEVLVGGLGTNPGPTLAHGCVDVELNGGLGDVCYGGRILSTAPTPALLEGCLCILGGPGGPGQCVSIPSGATLTPEQCTAESVAQCGDNVTTTPNDPACGGGNCEAPGCCVGATSCTDLSTASQCAGAGETFVAGHVCSDSECAVNLCGNGKCDPGETNASCPQDCPAASGCCQVGTSHCFECGDARCGSAACTPNGTCSIVPNGDGTSRGSCAGQ